MKIAQTSATSSGSGSASPCIGGPTLHSCPGRARPPRLETPRVRAVRARCAARTIRAAAWELWRATRDELFLPHPQTPLPDETRAAFTGLPYFDYDPALRVLATVEPAERVRREIATSGEQPYLFTRFARAGFDIHGQGLSLDLYWLEGYGGGVYLSFADATSGDETYGAGRYLLDTVKGSDLGSEEGRARTRLQLRLQPVLLLRPPLGLPSRPAREPAADRRPRRRALPRYVEAAQPAQVAREEAGDERRQESGPLVAVAVDDVEARRCARRRRSWSAAPRCRRPARRARAAHASRAAIRTPAADATSAQPARPTPESPRGRRSRPRAAASQNRRADGARRRTALPRSGTPTCTASP